jgi:cation diffusion facilitator family transporter
MQEGSRRAIVAAFLANLGIAVSKLVGFAITGSASLLAEAIHSLADTGNQALLFLGGARAKHAATAEHPFGYGRERFFWAFVVAVVLFTLGGAFALYEGIEKFRHPHELDNFGVAIFILLVAVALESWSFRTARHEANQVRPHGVGWWAFIRRTKSPELPVVLLEDSGALVGLFFALVGVTMAKITGNPRWDAVGSIAIGILLIAISVVLAVEMKGLLIGESASPATQVAIANAIKDSPEIQGIIHMKTEHIGPDELLVGVKVGFEPTLTIRDLADAINAVERRIRAAVPEARIIYIEPDVLRDMDEFPEIDVPQDVPQDVGEALP